MPEKSHSQVKNEYRLFRLYDDPFHDEVLLWTDKEAEDPVLWWKSVVAEAPLLASLGILLCSLPVSSAAVERSFSNLEFVHSKLRNRMTAANRKSLLYIYFNVRALHSARVRVLGDEKFRRTKGSGRLVVELPE